MNDIVRCFTAMFRAAANAVVSSVLVRSPCRVHYVNVVSTRTTDAFVMLFDAANVPKEGTTPMDCLPLPADGAATFAYPGAGQSLRVGLAWAVSSTAHAFTPVAVATTTSAFAGWSQ